MYSIFNEGEKDKRVRRYIMPKRIVWQSNNDDVTNGSELLNEKAGQATLASNAVCTIKNNGALLLDFGTELHGGVQIITQGCGKSSNTKLRVRFGESVMEAMSEIGEKNSTNDHAIRDTIIDVAFMGSVEFGNTGFRFVRLDLLGEGTTVQIKMVRAIFVYQEIEYKGSFSCSNDLLTKIWQTGAYTVHLNMQNYLWDGIKRDRLVWVGDMHPETSTIQAVFGYDDCVPKSLDLIREETPPEQWMNTIPTYSMWWIKIHHDWFMQNGDLEYLKEQKQYLLKLLENLFAQINEDGTNKIENKFIDWPTADNNKAGEAGVHALLVTSITAGQSLCMTLGEDEIAKKCEEALKILSKYLPDNDNVKQAASLLVLCGLLDAKKTNESVLSVNPARGLSTFLGYYVLKARAQAGDIKGCIDLIQSYWGAMINLGATTFWEDFNLDWLENATRIDEIVPEGKSDIHGDNGGYCYKGFRHSLCHGWASGPTAWMSEYILGVKVVEAGCKKIEIKPNLVDLDWVEGTYPTPYGVIKIKHTKTADGKIETKIDAPKEVTLIL